MSTIIDDAIHSSVKFKEAGNVHLQKALNAINEEERESYFKQALREYHNGYLYLRSVDMSESKKEGMDEMLTGFLEEKQKKTDEQKESIKKMKVAIWNNMSLIYLKQKKYERVESLVEDILRLEPGNEKALIKGINSGLEVNDFEKTKKRIQDLEKLGTTKTEEVDKFKSRLESKIVESSKEWKDKFKNVFKKWDKGWLACC